MAKAKYIGKYDSEFDVKLALTNGELLEPYVVSVGTANTIHFSTDENPIVGYVCEAEINQASVPPKDYDQSGEVSFTATTPVVVLYVNGHYESAWSLSEWGYDEGMTAFYGVPDNYSFDSRQLQIRLDFALMDGHLNESYQYVDYTTVKTMNLQVTQNGYIPGSWTLQDIELQSSTGSFDNFSISANTDNDTSKLYWDITVSDIGPDQWIVPGSYNGQGDTDTFLVVADNYSPDARSGWAEITFYFDYDRTLTANSCTISVSQQGKVIQDGSVSPTSFTQNYFEQWLNPYINGADLYWHITANNAWLQCNDPYGSGQENRGILMSSNPGATRNGSFTVDFYLDDGYQQLRNSVTVTIEQEGQNRSLASWNPDYLNQDLFVSSGSGVTNLYILNNPYDAYVLFYDFEGNMVSGDSSTTAYTFAYSASTQYEDETKGFNVDFYSDDQFASWVGSCWMNVTQEGDKNLSYIETDEGNVPSSGGTKNVYVHVNGNAVKWQLTLGSQGISFTDYPGESSISGNSSVAVSITVDANHSLDGQAYAVWAFFYDIDDTEISSMSLWISQDAASALKVSFLNGGDIMQMNRPSTWTGYAYMSIDELMTGYYYAMYLNDSYVLSGSTTGPLQYPVPSQAQSDIEYHLNAKCYSDAALTDEVADIPLTFTHHGPYSGDKVNFVQTFVTTAANQTVNISKGYGMDGSYMYAAILDNSDIINVGSGSYTFASAGTHTLEYSREWNDTYIQGWQQYSDMCSCSVSANTAWGFHGSSVGDGSSRSFLNCTNLTAVTFDDKIDIIGDNTFEGCTALTVINCYATSQPTIDGQSTFRTITNNQGTLHIPSGSSYPSWEAALGSNWTVVDDL